MNSKELTRIEQYLESLSDDEILRIVANPARTELTDKRQATSILAVNALSREYGDKRSIEIWNTKSASLRRRVYGILWISHWVIDEVFKRFDKRAICA